MALRHRHKGQGMRSRLSFAILVVTGSAAVAQDGPGATSTAPLRFELPIIGPGCDRAPSDDGEIVVCGRRDRRYRIDPAVLAVSRRLEARGGPRPEGRTALFNDGCSPVGLASCGQDVLPVGKVAITPTTALIKIIKGEDLKPMLRTVPSEYGLYRQSKADEAQMPRAPK